VQVLDDFGEQASFVGVKDASHNGTEYADMGKYGSYWRDWWQLCGSLKNIQSRFSVGRISVLDNE
jgi:hypothetical protein